MRPSPSLWSAGLWFALVAVACAPAPLSEPPPAIGSASPPVQGDTADTGGAGEWGEVVGRRFVAEEVAFYPLGDGFRAVQAGQGLEAEVGIGGARLAVGDHTIRLRVASFGHADARMEPRFAAAALGDCVSSGDVDMQETCISRVEIEGVGLREWWESTPEHIQVGWDVEASTGSRGPLELLIDVEGAEIEVTPDGVAATLQSPDRSVSLDGLAAWDDEGTALDAWMELRSGQLVLAVDDTEAQGTVHIDPYTLSAGRTWNGTSSSYFGRSVSGAGDVNLDGYDDVVVGSPNYLSSTGRVYVYHGSSSGISSSVNTTLTGLATSANFGRSVGSAGDVNRDGFDDVVVGADGVSSNTGAAYVFYGSATGVSSAADVTLAGTTGSFFGYSVDGAGDVDNDGYDDVIVGAYAVGTPNLVGAAYVYHGSPTGLATTATTTLAGAASLSSFGSSVRRAGDVNNDGYDDVIVGAPQYSLNTGYASVYHGSSSGVSSTASRTITGASSGDNLGISVSGAGDVDDDGYADVIVGSYGYSTYYGRAQVFHGSSSGVSGTATTSVTGPATSYFGYAVAGAGDMEGDGYGDVVVGGYIYSSSSGLVRTYSGSSSGVSSSYNSTVTGSSTSCLGFSVAGVGDTNGDGYDDIVAGGYCASSSTGVASVYYGQADADGDGYYVGSGVSTSSVDCDDTDSAINPGATEITDDGIDSNCDTREVCYDDDDNDGFLDTTADTRSSTDLDCADSYEGTSTDLTTDCDDSDSSDYPGATETTGNGDDEDCDGTEVCYDDDDDDGYLDTTGDTRVSSDTDCSDTYEGRTGDATTDCDDTSAAIKPGATEITGDGIDQNCDTRENCYDDDDDDGYLDSTGDTRSSTDLDCLDTYEGLSTDLTTDCDDTSATDYPGATEIVDNGDDESCDGYEACYDDDDDDGYLDTTGDTRASSDTDCLDTSEGRATDPTTDCDDSDAAIKPGATEITGDGVDQNCDSAETCYYDADNDGYRDTTAATLASTDSDCSDATEALSTDPTTDCDDTDAGDNPGAAETVGNGDDEDCDGGERCYDDDDNDGFLDTLGDLRTSSDSDCADAYEGTNTDLTTDCDDTAAAVYPGATDAVGDELDSDCDGDDTCYTDSDGDGFAVSTTIASTDADCSDAGEASAADLALGADCDDASATTYPGATERTGDGVDADCDGGEVCYSDVDLDGYSAGATVASGDTDCMDSGEVLASTYAIASDCDDTDAGVSPSATEVCDSGNTDEDCDTLADDDDASASTATMTTFYADLDGDGYGDAAAAVSVCDLPSGYVSDATDCNDTDATVHPGATDDTGANGDQDCDGVEWCLTDADADGYATSALFSSADADCADAGEAPATTLALGEDCADGNAAINPGATEVCDLGDVDEDCNGTADDRDATVDATTLATWYDDADGDSYGDAAASVQRCDVPFGYGTDSADCNDADALIHPGGEEYVGDEVDGDCDGTELCYADLDRDGWGGLGSVPSADVTCIDPGEVSAATYALGSDCDDANALVNPDSTEVCDDGDIDEDCNGLAEDADPGVTGLLSLWIDTDADLYGSEATNLFACDPTEGYATDAGDCNDADAAVNPAAAEVCNDIDDDCDQGVDEDAIDGSVWYPDGDGDGYGGALGVADCDQPAGYVTTDDDCDEDNAEVHPGAEEVCNELDDDCDGLGDPEDLCGIVEADPGDCGCSTNSGAAGAALLGAVAVLATRRRRG